MLRCREAAISCATTLISVNSLIVLKRETITPGWPIRHRTATEYIL
jgi:hypothetical protein